MTDLEKRAHDIAVAILPRMIEEDRLDYYALIDGRNLGFNAGDIIDDTSFQDLGRLEESESQRLQAVERSERIFADFGSPG